MSIEGYEIKQLIVMSQLWSLGEVEYPLIAITPRSILAQSGSIWCRPTMGQIEMLEI